MPDPTDERLAAVLASIGDHLVVPDDTPAADTPTPDPGANGSHPALPDGPARGGEPAGDGEPAGGGGGVRDRRRRAGEPEVGPRRRLAARARRPAERRSDRTNRRHDDGERWRRGLVAAAVIVVVATVVGVVAPVREAVASWFGIGSTGVERVDDDLGDPGDLPFLATFLAPVDRATAERELRAELPVPGRLGTPPVLGTPPEGGVVMAWADGATTLWVQRNPQRPDQAVSKLLTVDDRFERIDDLGEDAAIVEGAHVLETPLRRLAAGTVLIWLDGGFEYRLESDLDVDEMIATAHEISPG